MLGFTLSEVGRHGRVSVQKTVDLAYILGVTV